MYCRTCSVCARWDSHALDVLEKLVILFLLFFFVVVVVVVTFSCGIKIIYTWSMHCINASLTALFSSAFCSLGTLPYFVMLPFDLYAPLFDFAHYVLNWKKKQKSKFYVLWVVLLCSSEAGTFSLMPVSQGISFVFSFFFWQVKTKRSFKEFSYAQP